MSRTGSKARGRMTPLFIAGLLSLTMLGAASKSFGSYESTPSDQHNHDVLNPDPIGSDARAIAQELGITEEEARFAIELQPEVGRMEGELSQVMPESYGGAIMQYEPEYAIKIMVALGDSDRVERAIEDRGYSHLRRYVKLQETPYTTLVLTEAVERVRAISEGRVTSGNTDLRTGTIHVTAATDEDVSWIRQAVERHRQSISAAEIQVIQSDGGGEETESYGGLIMNQSDGTAPCTSGFSVRRTTDDSYGVTTAAHCNNGGYYLHQVLLDYVTYLYGGNHDVQWHRTPNLADNNWVKDGTGTYRLITSRTARADIVLDQGICVYGRIAEYDCGFVEKKNYQPNIPGTPHNATFIEVRSADTFQGDSGAPWFLGNSAYGIHKMSDPPTDNPVFMSQSYLSDLNLVVRIN